MTSFKIFFSYAQADEVWFRRLDTALGSLKRLEYITTWDKSKFTPGTEIPDEVDRQLKEADLIILLISNEFIEDDDCWEIISKYAAEQHAPEKEYIIPIIARPSGWKDTPLVRLRPLPRDGRSLSECNDIDAALTQIADEIKEIIERLKAREITSQRSTTSLSLWNVPFSRNSFFTGREDVLAHIRNRLSLATASPQPIAICGIAGVGKTQIVLEYAYRYRKEYQATFWIHSSTQEEFVAGMIDIARCLQQLDQTKRLDISTAQEWLGTSSGLKWLLILDNIEDLTLVNEYIPLEALEEDLGHILLTTRSLSMKRMAEKCELDRMQLEEGALLLLRRADILKRTETLAETSQITQEQALALVKELEGLPLALDQAGAYIEETGDGLSDYLDLYHEQRMKRLNERGSFGLKFDHPHSVAATLSLSIEQVAQNNSAAIALLRFCAFLAPDAIPEEIITKGAAALDPVLYSMATDRDILNKAISELRKHSLLKRDSASHMLSIHQLLQVVLKAQLDKKAHHHWAECAVRAVSKTFPRVGFPLQLHDIERLLPHVHICKKLIADENLIIPEAADLLSQAGLYFFHRFQDQKAKSFYEHAWKIYEQLSDAYASDRARILNYSAIFYKYQNNYQQAEALYQSALKILEGKQEPGTRIRLASLISSFLTLVKGKLAGRTSVSNMTSIINNQAVLYEYEGQYQQAEQLYLHVLKIHEMVPDLDHSITATTLNNLANLYQYLGHYERALVLYQLALKAKESRLGPNHTETLVVINNLANLYRHQNNYEQAEMLYQRIFLTVEEPLLEEGNHPGAAPIHDSLALLYMSRQDYEQAESYYQQALEIKKQIPNAQHPDLARTLNNLANLCQRQGNYKQAEIHYQRALQIKEQSLGPYHPDTAATLNNLANLYQQRGLYKQAESFYQRALTIYERVLGNDHHHIKTVQKNYAYLLLRQIKQKKVTDRDNT